MNELAKLYVNGIGVEQSYPMAVTWFRRAADLGSAEAMVLLVELHNQGVKVGYDGKQAFEWCKQAAAANHPEAIFFWDLPS